MGIVNSWQTVAIALVLIIKINLLVLSPAWSEEFSLGVIAPLTGPRSDAGAYMKCAVEIAINDSTAYFPHPVVFVIEDSAYEPARALTAFKKLTKIDRVSVIIGPTGSSEVLAIAPLAEQSRMVVIVPGAQSAEISAAGDYIFRTIHNSAQEGSFFAPEVAKRMRGEKLGVLAVQTAFTPSYLKHFGPALAAAGKGIGKKEEFSAAELDFRTQLLRFKGIGLRDLLLLAAPRQLGHIMVQAKQLNYTPQFYSAGAESNEIALVAGPLADGLIFAYSYDSEAESSKARAFSRKYRRRCGTEPEAVGANTYDAIMLALSCVKRGAGEGEKLKNCLYETQDYEGVGGILSMDSRGDAVKPLFLKTIKNGRFIRLSDDR